MRRRAQRLFITVMLAAAATTSLACHHHRGHRSDGPATHAGRHIDHAADRTGDVIEGAGRKVNRALPGD